MSKRSRCFRSSSAGEIGVSSPFQPIRSPVAYWEAKRPALSKSVHKPAPVKNTKPPPAKINKEEGTRRCLFTIDSPNTETASKRNRGDDAAEFLQACFLCKKNLKANDDVFMYGALGAFCSPDCRDSQMALDGFEKEVSRESARIVRAGNLKNKDMPRLGFGNQHKYQV